MTVLVTTLAARVAGRATMCPTPVLKEKVLEAARELCRVGAMWSEELAPIDIVANQKDYTLTPVTADAEMLDVAHVAVSGSPIEVVGKPELDLKMPTWRTATGGVIAATIPKRGQLRLVRIPNASITGGLVVEVTLRPTLTATTLPDELADEWQDAMVWGGIARVCGMRDYDWFDPATASNYEKEFEAEMAKAKARRFRGISSKGRAAYPRRFV